jgi:hypothetical protein
MPIREKVTKEDLLFYDILKHPVFNGEFLRNIDKLDYEEEFIYDIYQKEMLCDFNHYVSIACARAVGKTLTLVSILIWILTNNLFPQEYVVYSVPNKSQLEPVWTGLVRMFRSNSFLRWFLEPKKGINSSDHTIKLLNTASLLCRIAGTSGGGANVIGLHTPFEIIDESGYYPWGTWLELQPTLNTWQTGFRQMTSGVPTGLRENNVLYHADMEDDGFTKHRVSAYQNPRFTEEDEKRAIIQYGGKDSEDFAHMVLGEHGSPVFSVFDRRLFEILPYEIYRLTINGIKLKDNIQKYIEKIAMLPKLPSNTDVLFGIDLGYTDPTAIIIMYLTKTGKMRFHCRVQLTKVSYNMQDKFIDLLDTKFKPSLIGVDEGAAGKAVVQRLQEADEFAHKNYKTRLIPINFSSALVIGEDLDGNEIKSRTKPFSVSILQDYSNSHRITYSSTDPEMMTELERMIYTKNPNGDIVYKTLTPLGGKRGADHFTAALLCGCLAYYLENESFVPKRKPKKLFGARWIT